VLKGSSNGLLAAAAPSVMRTMNQRLLLGTLYSEGPATRPQLAKAAGLSLPTVSAALAELEAAGLTRSSPRTEVTTGRPAVLFEANPSAGAVAAVDLGREWIRVVVTDLLGNRLARTDTRNTARGATKLVSLVGAAVRGAVEQAGAQPSDVTHTVIGSPGVLRPGHGQVAFAANLPGWQRPGLVESLKAQLGESLTIDNDANLAALGELADGAGVGVSQLVYLHIGTGVGLGIVIDGELYRGSTGAAGEVAYMPPGPFGPLSSSPSPRGMLEETLAADAVVRYAQEAGMSGTPTAAEVFSAARAGERPAVEAVRQEALRLAYLVVAIGAFLDPELIVLGGGVGQNLDLLEPPLREEVQHLSPLAPRLAAAALGAEAVLQGAVSRGVAIARESVFLARLGALSDTGA
jgi:predicted NBD/HSP70 family sugar kinase